MTWNQRYTYSFKSAYTSAKIKHHGYKIFTQEQKHTYELKMLIFVLANVTYRTAIITLPVEQTQKMFPNIPFEIIVYRQTLTFTCANSPTAGGSKFNPRGTWFSFSQFYRSEFYQLGQNPVDVSTAAVILTKQMT